MEFQQGDIIYVDFSPTSGHEQSGKRPALVVSNDDFNQITGLVVVCPITSKIKDFPSHINLDDRTETVGQVLCEHVRTLDVKARNATKKEECPSDILLNVIKIVKSIL